MIVPERSNRIRKFTVPTWYLRAGIVIGALLVLTGIFVFFDYLHVMSQVAENKQLRVENRTLRSDIQTAKNKLESLDQSVARLKSFAHKLRIITNLDQPGSQKILQAPNGSSDGNDAGGKPGAGGKNPMVPYNGGGMGEPSGEDSGMIQEPGKPQSEYVPPPVSNDSMDGQLEVQRSLTVLGELGQQFYEESLVNQVAQLTEASIKLNEITRIEEKNFAALQENLQDRVIRLLSTPSLMPAQGWISSEFGYRYNPFSGVRTFHAGLDIANNYGTSIFAPADGTVTTAGEMGGFGQVVRISHGYNIVTKYGHTARILVRAGQKVTRGQKIATMGSSGRSTGPHLHYQVEVSGRPVNPRLFILEDTF